MADPTVSAVEASVAAASVPGGARWLEMRVEAIDTDVREAQLAWLQAMDRRVRQPFQMRLLRAVRSHQRLQAQTDFGTEQGQQALWRELMAYRQGTRSRVLEPLRTFLTEGGHADVLGNTFGEMLSSLAGLGTEVPVTVTLPEAADLYQAEPYDSTVMRVRKAFV